jgi:ADP-ribose pyrophosphatase
MAISLQMWTDKNSQKVYSGPRFEVRRASLLGKQGNTIQRDFIVHPGAVVILPFLDREQLVMIRNERLVVGQELWELPAGTLEPEELPIETAKREIVEETGYQASQMELLTSFYTTPGFCNEVMHAYTAKGLTYVGQALEETEKIKVEIVSWQRAMAMMKEGTICDAKTTTTLLFYQAFFMRSS